MSGITLKVHVVKSGQSKTLPFKDSWTVSQAIKFIGSKTGAEVDGQYGLFLPKAGKNLQARWLKNDRLLRDCELRSDYTVELKKRTRPLKVKLEDGTVKTVLVDESQSVGEVIAAIGKKMGLKNADEFALQLDGGDAQKWLVRSQSLTEQGVGGQDAVVLKKQFFVSDQNLDRSDPVALHLVYAQSLRSILAGEHPLTNEECANLAALQCQIVYGNFNPSQHRPGFLGKEKEKLIPPQFHAKLATIEPLMVAEYKKLVGMTEVNAKFRYVSDCRRLKTYGMTTYATKQKQPGKKKPVDRYLGVTRDAILLLDGETREIMREFPLTHLRRWAAASKTITLDFGDYEDDYLSLLTDEADTISQLIGGYIDILLKKRKEGVNLLDDNGEEVAQIDTVTPVRGMAVGGVQVARAKRGGGGTSAGSALGGGGQAFDYVQGPAGQQLKVHGLSDASRGVRQMLDDAAEGGAPQQYTLSYDQAKAQMLTAADGAMKHKAIVSELVESGCPPVGDGNLNMARLNAEAARLGDDVATLLNAARGAAADGNLELLEHARSVADAVARMLAAADELANNPHDKAALAEFKSASAAFDAQQAAMKAAVAGHLADEGDQRLLLAAAKDVASSVSELLRNMNEPMRACKDPTKRNAMTAQASAIDDSAQNMLSAARMMAPTIVDAGCRDQLDKAAKAIKAENARLLAAAKAGGLAATDYQDLLAQAKLVGNAIANLMRVADEAESRAPGDAAIQESAGRYVKAAGDVGDAAGKPRDIVAAMKKLAAAQNTLVGHVKAQANELRGAHQQDERARLGESGKKVGEATARLVAAGKEAAKAPKDGAAQARLKDAAHAAQEAARALVRENDKQGATALLRTNAKYSAAAAMELNTVIATARAKTGDERTDQALLDAAKRSADAMARLLDAVRDARAPTANAADAGAQFDRLAEASRAAVAEAFPAVAESKRALPLIEHDAGKQDLSAAANESQNAIKRLNEAAKKERVAGANEFDDAFRVLANDGRDVDTALVAAINGTLVAQPGQSKDTALSLLTNGARQLAGGAMNVAKASAAPRTLGQASKSAAETASQVVQAARALAACTPDKATRVALLEHAKQLNAQTGDMVTAAQGVASAPADKAGKVALAKSAKASAAAVADLVKLARTTETGACDDGIVEVDKALATLRSNPPPPAGGGGADFKPNAQQLVTSCKQLEQSAKQLVAATQRDKRLQETPARALATKVPIVVAAANATSVAAGDAATQRKVLDGSRAVVKQTRAVFEAAKAAKPADQASVDGLLKTAQQLSRLIADLVGACDTLTPDERKIADAMAAFDDAASRVGTDQAAADDGSAGAGAGADASSLTYAQATQALVARAKELLGAMSKVSAAAKSNAKAGLPAEFERVAVAMPRFVAAGAAAGAVSTPAVQREFDDASRQIGDRGTTFLANAKGVYDAPRSQPAQTALAGSYKETAAAVKALIEAIQKGATGARACDSAIATMDRLIGELKSGLYATPPPSAAPNGERDVVERAKAAAAASAAFVALEPAATARDQALLGDAAQRCSTAVVDLANAAKLAREATLESDRAHADAVLGATRQLVEAERRAVAAGKAYHANPGNERARTAMNESTAALSKHAERLVGLCGSGEETPNERAVAEAQDQLRAAIDAFADPSHTGAADVEVDDVVNAARAVAQEAATIVAATGRAARANKAGDDRAVADAAASAAATAGALLDTTKGALATAKDAGARERLTRAATETARSVDALLAATRTQAHKPTADGARGVSKAAATVGTRVTDVVGAAEAGLPQARKVRIDSGDENLEELAERELAECSKAIEAAAAMLTAMPKRARNVDLDEFDSLCDAILEATQSIAGATQQLVVASAKVQKELTAQGRANPSNNAYRKDPTWARGLISAAQAVAGGVKHLVAAANRAASKEGSEEELIATSRQVNAATVRLVAASRAKANPASPQLAALGTAAGQVQRATTNLVDHASKYSETVEGDAGAGDDDSKLGAVARLRKQQEEREELARLEAQLAAAESDFLSMNKKNYKG